MNKVFKASILAASVALAFGANAATVSSTAQKLSKEGLAVGLDSTANIVFDVVVAKEHASSSTIVLTLSDKVDLATNTVTGGACTNDPALGTGICGDVSFNYGTGSFTFDSVVIDDAANTITFNVNLGNPLTANSAFRTTIGGSPIVSGAATVSYASNLAGTPIETGVGQIAEELTQYAMSVKTELDGVIDRADRNKFVRNSENVNGLVDTLVLNVTDASASVLNPAFANGTVVTVKGDFSDAVVHAPAQWVSTAGATVARVDANTLTLTYTEAQFATASAAKLDTVTFTFINGANTIDASKFVGSVKHDFNSLTAGAGTDGTEALLTSEDFGQWTLDAAVVNVPYLPLGYGLTPNVEIANAGSSDAEIQVEAFDQFSNEFKAVTLPMKAKAHTVTKISEADLQAALGITKAKTSVTFIVDADLNDITLVPYYKEGTSRINVLADQYKSDTAR